MASRKKIYVAPIQLTTDAEAVLDRVYKSWYTPKLLVYPNVVATFKKLKILRK